MQFTAMKNCHTPSSLLENCPHVSPSDNVKVARLQVTISIDLTLLNWHAALGTEN